MNSTDTTIKVDIEELIDKLTAMVEEGFTVAQLSIITSNYMNDFELRVGAVDLSEDENIEYGSIACIPDEF